MKLIQARNVQQALPLALDYLFAHGVPRGSRYGDTITAPQAVVTTYERPCERVLFWPERDANPFFHFFEGLWMLAGRNDVAFLVQFARRMREFSDDGVVFHGAYGHRWRHWPFRDPGYAGPGYEDQLKKIAMVLANEPNDRRQVLAMWDPERDLGGTGKDLPCNTHAYFRIREGRLCLTVCCRSNDVVWGCYGANAVHFSMLLEYMAAWIGVPVGTYEQVSNDWHGYRNTVDQLHDLSELVDPLHTTQLTKLDPYARGEVGPYPMVGGLVYQWTEDLHRFMDWADNPGNARMAFMFRSAFFNYVARPLYLAHRAHKQRKYTDAYLALEQCEASDWRRASTEWVQRREQTWKTHTA